MFSLGVEEEEEKGFAKPQLPTLFLKHSGPAAVREPSSHTIHPTLLCIANMQALHALGCGQASPRLSRYVSATGQSPFLPAQRTSPAHPTGSRPPCAIPPARCPPLLGALHRT